MAGIVLKIKKTIVENLPDRLYIPYQYSRNMHKKLNLKNPETFCEKLQWLKLYDRNPLYTTIVDKIAVKDYITKKIGSEYVVPMVGGPWDSFSEIDFDKLPDQFVLKCSHDSGGFVVCTDKSKLDIEDARKKINACLEKNFYRQSREWPYKNVKPRIFAEAYLDTLGKPESIEYKLTCCDGVCKNVTICGGIAHVEYEKRTNDNYDRDLNHLNWWAYYKPAKTEPVVDRELIGKIIEIAEKLSEGIPQVRVDFYVHHGKIYFGEMTFFTWGGYIEFNPPEQDKIMGGWIRLPEKRK